MRARDAVLPADRLRIEASLLDALEESAADVCVLVVRACDEYAQAPWRLGVLLAALAGCGLAAAFPWLPAAVVLSAQALGLAAGLALTRLDPVRRMLFSESLADRRAVARAERGFAEVGLEAADGAGLLVFVALLERRVLLMAGGRVARIARHEAGFAEIARSLAASVRRGAPAEGLLEAVERVGKLLESRLPAPRRDPAGRTAAVVLED